MCPVFSCHHRDSAEIVFDDVVASKTNLLGTRSNAYREILTVFNSRADHGRHARSRRDLRTLHALRPGHAFRGPIARFQSLQHYLADMCINFENAWILTY
jgi:alkylation response protein AidB-like acyl-CoA dehydrogenase